MAALDALDRATRGFLVIVVAVMVAVVSAQVVARYGLNTGIGWADEVSRLAFVWCVFLGVAVAVKARAHIGIGLLVDALPAALGGVVRRIVLLACAALSAVVSWQASAIAAEQWDERMISLELSSGWFLVPVAAGGALSALHLLAGALMREPPA
ncbi:TRAP transporter small permease [Roseomonas sp. HF4]|uniref:TRAP transporter small permease n=1 Tax=Roseomonas sp. HF4 TaxID=2562313 RepID=UPI0010C00420|nr:TRAP transporter small permease subunit [Roseomonas sp. HF4]